MLENLITKRGGLEGNNKSEYGNYLNQQEFESFFQQIKPYLTVQEQIDLFLELQKRGSPEAGFLAFLALTAIGFSRRKPEKLFDARKILKRLNISGLDSMPLIGCLDLLLADIDQASARFSSSSDIKLRDWLDNYPGNRLEAICIYCKNWLENDVLVGYRDIDLKQVDLDSWFEDREIQEFIEKLEKKSNKTTFKSNLQNQLIKKEFSTTSSKDFESKFDDERRLPWPGGIKKEYAKQEIQEENFNDERLNNKPLNFYKYLIEKIAEIKFSFGEFLEDKKIISRSPYLLYFFAFLILFSFGIGIGFLRNNSNKYIENDSSMEKTSQIAEKNKELNEENIINENIKENKKISSNPTESNSSTQIDNISLKVKEIKKASPSIEEIKYLIETWLSNKSNYMARKGELNLSKIVKDGLIKRTIEDRQKDIKEGVYQEISSQIQEIVLKSQTSSRIVAVAELKYSEKIFKNSGELVNEISINPLKVRYILGFSNKSWKLVDFVSGV
jgi:hypothetical protein